MERIGKIESVYRYPVKSMRGEAPSQIFLSFSGVYGDRLYAFRSPAAPVGFPYHTGREHEDLLLYQPRYRNYEQTLVPPNLAEAEALAPGITPVYGERDQFAIDITTPEGTVIPIESSELTEGMQKAREDEAPVSLAFSQVAMTDCRPISLISLQTVDTLQNELGSPVDKRRFRANLYADLSEAGGLVEKDYVGKTIQIGDKAVLSFLERDPRCKMICLDPDTADHNPKLLQLLAEKHDGRAGIYAAVLVEGVVKAGDPVVVL
jgi:uncharacterized protein YcbX